MKIRLFSERDPNLTAVEQILINRGVLKEDIPQFINTQDDVIASPFLLDNIQRAVNSLITHLEGKSKMLLVVDCDADGFTSSAEFYNYMYANFNDIDIDFQFHEGKFHGIENVEDIIEKGYSLVIAPDSASNQYEEHSILKEAGIDIIVLDHHDCEKESSDAIVVNNQLSENYDNKGLCGAGVVFQFLRVMDVTECDSHKRVKTAFDFIDLAALGLIADMSDMKDLETKRLIELGIIALAAPVEDFSEPNTNPFLAGLIDKNSYSIGQTITPISLAFYVAPFINAVVRVGTMEEKALTFESMLDKNVGVTVPSLKRGHKPGDTETVLGQALRVLTNVKNRQIRVRDKTFNELEKTITKESLENNAVIVLDTKGKLDKNLNGLVANQIMAKYSRPVLVLAEKDGFFSGSGRNYECEQMPDLRTFIADSDLAEYASGHGNAFGTSFTQENLDKFISYANERLNYKNTEAEYNVDFIFDGTENIADKVLDIGALSSIWGKGMTEPYVFIEGIRINNKNKVLYSPDKNPTLKITSNGVSFMKFRFDKELYAKLAPNEYTDTIVNIVGRCSINHWNGNSIPQVMIQQFEVVSNISNL